MKPLPRDSRAIMGLRHEPAGSADFAPTPPWGGRALVEVLQRVDPRVAAGEASAWEPACGAGHLAHGVRQGFAALRCSDLFHYGWGHEVLDFLSPQALSGPRPDWVVVNPPFGRWIEPFVRRSWEVARRGAAVLLQLRALEGLGRHALFEDVPLYAVCPFAERLAIHMGGWSPAGNTATAYAWFVFVRPEALADGVEPAVAGGRRIAIPPGSQRRHSRLSDARFARRGPDGRVGVRDLVALGGLPAGMTLDAGRMETLAQLGAQGPGGTCGLPSGPLNGARLAWLVQAGLAERMAGDALGGCRYRPSAVGAGLLRDSGWDRAHAVRRFTPRLVAGRAA